MTSFFGGKDRAGGAAAGNGRISRHSSGWGQLLQRMRGEESLRVQLDRLSFWQGRGAQLSPTVARLVKQFSAKAGAVASPAGAQAAAS